MGWIRLLLAGCHANVIATAVCCFPLTEHCVFKTVVNANVSKENKSV